MRLRPWIVVALLLGFLHAATAEENVITMSSTTSTQASGFFDYYLPLVKKATGVEVRVIAVGSGQALKLGEQGDADVLLVHDKAGELAFVDAGYGEDRREVMYNDFIVVGPASDPAHINGQKDVVAALKAIAEAKSPFASRADDSGTHRTELRLWALAEVDARAASGTWYKELGTGMGETLNTTVGLEGYTLSDRATWLTFGNRGSLRVLVEGDPRLFNQYSLILVSHKKHPHVKTEAARLFVDYMTSAEGQAAIAAFKVGAESPFKPNYGEKK